VLDFSLDFVLTLVVLSVLQLRIYVAWKVDHIHFVTDRELQQAKSSLTCYVRLVVNFGLWFNPLAYNPLFRVVILSAYINFTGYLLSHIISFNRRARVAQSV
jgi:hypothetical protein